MLRIGDDVLLRVEIEAVRQGQQGVAQPGRLVGRQNQPVARAGGQSRGNECLAAAGRGRPAQRRQSPVGVQLQVGLLQHGERRRLPRRTDRNHSDFVLAGASGADLQFETQLLACDAADTFRGKANGICGEVAAVLGPLVEKEECLPAPSPGQQGRSPSLRRCGGDRCPDATGQRARRSRLQKVASSHRAALGH
jgi:hypothetical protein